RLPRLEQPLQRHLRPGRRGGVGRRPRGRRLQGGQPALGIEAVAGGGGGAARGYAAVRGRVVVLHRGSTGLGKGVSGENHPRYRAVQARVRSALTWPRASYWLRACSKTIRRTAHAR